MLGEAEIAAAKKLSENEARVTELTDRWKDRWKETQRILEVCTIVHNAQVILVWNCSGFQGLHGKVMEFKIYIPGLEKSWKLENFVWVIEIHGFHILKIVFGWVTFPFILVKKYETALCRHKIHVI